MKLFFQILGLLFFSFLYSSCQDPCEDVDCYNGGWCDDGDCECPPGVYGKYCGLRDATCTCTSDAVILDGTVIVEEYVTVINCTGCDLNEIETFEQACANYDASMTVDGVSMGACVFD